MSARTPLDNGGPSALPSSSTFRRLPSFASTLRRHERHQASSVTSTAQSQEAQDNIQSRSTTFSSLSRILGGDPSTKGARVSMERDPDTVSDTSRTPSRISGMASSPPVLQAALPHSPQSRSSAAASAPDRLASGLPSFSTHSDSLEPITYSPQSSQGLERLKAPPEAMRPGHIVPTSTPSRSLIGVLEPPISLAVAPPIAHPGGLLPSHAEIRGSGGPPTGVPRRKESMIPPSAIDTAADPPQSSETDRPRILNTPLGRATIGFSQVPTAVPMLTSSSNHTAAGQSLDMSASPSAEPAAADEPGPSRPRRRGSRSKIPTQQRTNSTTKVHYPSLTANAALSRVPASSMYFALLPSYGLPPSRPLRAHSGTLIGDKYWIIGGVDGKRCWRGVSFLDTETLEWQSVTTCGEQLPPLRAHTATAVGDKLYIFGGGDGPAYSNEVWVFDTATHRFSQPRINALRPHHPPPRRAHTTVMYHHYLVVFGGGNGQAALNDVWALDISDPENLTWHEWRTRGQIPQKKGYHTANLVGHKMIVYGGSDGHASFADIHILNLQNLTWTLVHTDLKHNRLSHTSTQVGSYIFVLGGHSGQSYAQDILLFNLVTLQWETRLSRGQLPPGRGYHVAFLHDARIIVFGGYNGTTVFDDLWALELGASAYLPQVTTFEVDETSAEVGVEG